jgi:hypothetical protein
MLDICKNLRPVPFSDYQITLFLLNLRGRDSKRRLARGIRFLVFFLTLRIHAGRKSLSSIVWTQLRTLRLINIGLVVSGLHELTTNRLSCR